MVLISVGLFKHCWITIFRAGRSLEMKKSDNKKYNLRNVTVYLSDEAKQQIIFLCKLHNMTPSGLCRKVIMAFLNKQNVMKQMIEYALKQIVQNDEVEQ